MYFVRTSADVNAGFEIIINFTKYFNQTKTTKSYDINYEFIMVKAASYILVVYSTQVRSIVTQMSHFHDIHCHNDSCMGPHKKDQSKLRRLRGQMKYILYVRWQYGIPPRTHEAVRTQGASEVITRNPVPL